MNFDSVTFFLDDVSIWRPWFLHTLGFTIGLRDGPCYLGSPLYPFIDDLQPSPTYLQHQDIQVTLQSTSTSSTDAKHYLTHHPPGVMDVGFQVTDIERAFHQALQAGAKPIQPIITKPTRIGRLKQATVSGWGGLRHTLTEYIHDSGYRLPLHSSNWRLPHASRSLQDLSTQALPSTESHTKYPTFSAIDHAVMNVPTGEMQDTAAWYADAFGFRCQQTFDIQTPHSALRSVVMVHPEGNATLPINEPASPYSQIQEFLDMNNGAGIQHIALSTSNIIRTVQALRENGMKFLSVPPSYYEELPHRPGFKVSGINWEAIAQQEILVDWQPNEPDAILLQTFTQPIFNEPTFFFEIIQRQSYFDGLQYQHAKGFGEGNFQALFEAMEREQIKRGSLPL